VRYEVMTPTLPDLWDKIGQKPSGEPVEVTQYASRNRCQRRVVCEDTGNVFLILADYCCTKSGEGGKLSQVEIEFLGREGFDDSAASPLNKEQIDADFKRIEGVVLETPGITPTGSRTTKQDWLTALAHQ
jgi:hypothetical protein